MKGREKGEMMLHGVDDACIDYLSHILILNEGNSVFQTCLQNIHIEVT